MMDRDSHLLSHFAIAMIAALLSLASLPPIIVAAGRDVRESIICGGIGRWYELHIPPGYSGKRPMPLVIVLHGTDMTGATMRGFTNFNEIADQRGFMVAYPDSFGPSWNDGRTDIHSPAYGAGIDDVKFISAMIDNIGRKYRIDYSRVYAAGFSNGGMMAFRLGIAISKRLAAVAAVAATLPRELAVGVPAMPISVIIVHGTADTTVPWEGGVLSKHGKKHGEVLSVLDTVLFWASRNRCGRRAKVSILPDRDPDDGMMVFHIAYRCAPGADTLLLAIQGGGHTWPMRRYTQSGKRPEMMTGDLDVTEFICDFFLRHRR